MSDAAGVTEGVLRDAVGEIEGLRARIGEWHRRTKYEDFEHADMGLQIERHAIEEIMEHTGLGGHIEPVSDPEAHERAESWLADVRRLRDQARDFLSSRPSEDLETALKASSIAEGSLEEVAERYV